MRGCSSWFMKYFSISGKISKFQAVNMFVFLFFFFFFFFLFCFIFVCVCIWWGGVGEVISFTRYCIIIVYGPNILTDLVLLS